MAGEYAFKIDSNVGRYWLANGEGFDVVLERGRRVGVVEDVVVNPLTHEVSSVVVKRRPFVGVRRPARVAIGDLTAVLPASRRFLVARSPARRSRTAWIRVTTTQTLRGSAHGASAVLASVRDAARAHWPAVKGTIAVAAARAGDALIACVTVSVDLAEWSWETLRERLRESGREAHSRVRRAR